MTKAFGASKQCSAVLLGCAALLISTGRVPGQDLRQVLEPPTWGTFYLLSCQGDGTPPYPFDPYDGALPVYEIDGIFGIYLIADSPEDFAIMAGEGALGGEMFTMDEGEPPPPPGEGGTNEWTYEYTPLVFTTNDLWLEPMPVTNFTSTLIVHPPATEGPSAFDLFCTTNLSVDAPVLNGANWQWMLRMPPLQTNLVVANLARDRCLFVLGRTNDADADGLSTAFESLVSHSCPTNSDSDDDGMPDGWEWNNFGSFDPTASGNYDGDWDNNLEEYGWGYDPNTIRFGLLVTNRHVRMPSVPVQLEIRGGVPSSMALLVNDTNFAGAVWQPFASNVVATLGGTDGEYDVWVGLRGRLEASQQTWVAIPISLDTMPPVLTVTNPPGTTVARSLIQLQGYVNEFLSRLTFDLSNAAGILTNQPGYETGQCYDTNLFRFSTSLFQCYDIELTNGLNAITLHATDLAGNTSMTNVNLTLDFFCDTNLPVARLIWPRDGTVIAGSNCTLRASVDDATATVAATVVDSTGTTNTVGGLVTRKGEVWIHDLPLGNGSNALSVLFTTVSGSSSTNISVTSTNVGLVIEPLAGNQLNCTNVTLSGSVGNSSYQVEVNGVMASVEAGGTWQANDVTVSASGTASVAVNVYDSAHNLIASQTFDQGQPATIGLMSYSSSSAWHQEGGGVYYDPTETMSYSDSFMRVHWAYETGGCDSGYDFYTGSVYPHINPGRDERWTKSIPAGQDRYGADWCSVGFSAARSETYAFQGFMNWITQHGYWIKAERTETRVMIEPPDQAATGEMAAYVVQAQAWSRPEPPEFLDPPAQLPIDSLSIRGEPLTAVTNVDGSVWGQTVVVAPAGAPVEVTPSAGAANYVYSNKVTELRLRIVDATNPSVDFTDDTNAVIVGQRINLLCKVTPTNLVSSGYQWTIPGWAISNYVADVNAGTVFSDYPTINSNVFFYWVDGATNRQVTCSVTIRGEKLPVPDVDESHTAATLDAQ